MALVSHIFAQNSSVNFSIVGGDGMDDFAFEPIEITEDDLIDITEENYKETLRVEDEALKEFMEDLEG